jgi:hypothetical protein
MTTDKFTIPVLTPSNYYAWATQVEHILAVQGVWDIVSGEEKEPQQPEVPRDDAINDGSDSTPMTPTLAPSPTFEQDHAVHKVKVARANAVLFANMSQTIVEEHKKYCTGFHPSSGKLSKSDMLLGLQSVGFQRAVSLLTHT